MIIDATNKLQISNIISLAEDAGEAIMTVYRSGEWTVSSKQDKSPITQADLAANEVIVPRLLELTNDPIVSEESDPSSVQVGRRFWLVDPLDGTRDFVAKLDTFVVCIALIEDFYPILGVIHSPVTGETWRAEKGQGAFGPGNKRLLHPADRTSLIAAGSRSSPNERMQGFYDLFSIGEVHRYGSALKFCRLAEGAVDLYPRFGHTSEWDTAAGQIIAEESGCKVIDISSGERLRYGKPGFLNGGGFMASRADLNLVEIMRAKGMLKLHSES